MAEFFKYRALTDFEKVLFLEKQVKEILKIAKDRGVEIGKLRAELDEKEYEALESTKIKNYREQIENLQKSLNRKKRKILFWRAKYEAEVDKDISFEDKLNQLLEKYE